MLEETLDSMWVGTELESREFRGMRSSVWNRIIMGVTVCGLMIVIAIVDFVQTIFKCNIEDIPLVRSVIYFSEVVRRANWLG